MRASALRGARSAASSRNPRSEPAPSPRRTVTEAEFAKAFAVILARDDKAMLYGPGNDDAHGWRSIFGAARFAETFPGRAYFVNVAPDVFAGDWDAKGNQENVWTLHEELKAAGMPSVLVASGQVGHYQALARIPDRAVRERFATRAKALGFDVRDAIRPPLSHHRLWGTADAHHLAAERSRPLDPKDPLDALVALAPTTAPPPQLRGRIRKVAFDGDPDDYRSGGAAATTLAQVNRGWSLEGIERFLMDPRHRAGAKLQKIHDPKRRRARVEQLYRSAVEKCRTTPPRRARPAIDQLLHKIVEQLRSMPRRWRGRRGAALYVLARMLVVIAERCGSLTLTPGCRRLAEEIGSNRRTVARYVRALDDMGVLELAKEGGGLWPHTLRLVVDRDRRSDRARGSRALARDSASSPSGPSSPGGVREKWDHGASSLRDFTAADVFGPKGWFQMRGVGFEAWHALILLEDAHGPVSRALLSKQLGASADRVLRNLLRLRVVVRVKDGFVRGPTTLTDGARALRTLGTRTWKRAHHVAERKAYRRSLPVGVSAASDDEEQAEEERARVLGLARRHGFPRVLCDGGEEAWRRQVASASRDSLKAMRNALAWYAQRQSGHGASTLGANVTR